MLGPYGSMVGLYECLGGDYYDRHDLYRVNSLFWARYLGLYCFVFKSIRRVTYVSHLLDRWHHFIWVVRLSINSVA